MNSGFLPTEINSCLYTEKHSQSTAGAAHSAEHLASRKSWSAGPHGMCYLTPEVSDCHEIGRDLVRHFT